MRFQSQCQARALGLVSLRFSLLEHPDLPHFYTPENKIKKNTYTKGFINEFLIQGKNRKQKRKLQKIKKSKKIGTANYNSLSCTRYTLFLLIINFLFFSPYTSHTWSYIFFCFMIKSREENAEQIRTRRRSTSLSKRRQTQIAIKNKVNQTTSRQV